MANGYPDVKSKFEAAIPDDFLKRSITALQAAYVYAYDRLYPDLEVSELHDALPIVRRAMFETNWRKVAQRYGLKAKACSNSGGNCFYTRVHNQTVYLTESYAKSPHAMVRSSLFRKGMATLNQMHFSFPGFEAEDNPEPGDLYAILIHGTSHWLDLSPSFVHVVFPDAEYSCYADRIDLLQKFAGQELHSSDEIEDIGDELEIALRGTDLEKRGQS